MARPLWSQRQSDDDIKDFFVLRPGVPNGLLASLVDFVINEFYGPNPFGGLSPVRDRINRFARISDRYLPDSVTQAEDLFEEDRLLLLNAVDFVLGTYELVADSETVAELNGHLEEARSAYVIRVGGDGLYELQDLQPAELTTLVEEATSGTDRAAEHLRRAWSKAFARTPDPNAACAEAVAAIEAAAKPVVSLNNPRTTLGTILRDMKAKPEKWSTDSAAECDVESVIAMMDTVWTGHYRHGDETQPIDVSDEGAEMTVQLAAVLVHWFRSGRIRLR